MLSRGRGAHEDETSRIYKNRLYGIPYNVTLHYNLGGCENMAVRGENMEEKLRRIKLVVAYDGTNYCGWQVQPNGVSIQSMLQQHIEELIGDKILLTGASRTDSGVHALGQVAVFDTTKTWPAERFVPALNQRLPKDINIQSAEEVPLDFHPRYQNTLKTYEYRILNSRVPVPTQRLYSYFVPQPLDVEAMEMAAKEILGTHDFHNFSSTKTKVKETAILNTMSTNN